MTHVGNKNTMTTEDRQLLLRLANKFFSEHKRIINKTWDSSILSGDKIGDQNVGFNAIHGLISQWLYHANSDTVPDDGYTKEKINTIIHNLHIKTEGWQHE